MGKNENIEITRILDIIKSKKLIILIILIVFILFGYIYSFHCIVPKYKSTSTLLLIPNSTAEGKVIMTSDLAVNSDLTVNSGLIETYRKIGENSKVLKQVINNLELDMTEEELLKDMKITVVKETYVIQVAVTNEDPQKAMDIAKEFDEVFLKEIKEIYHLNNIGVVDEAQLPEKPYNINHIKDMVMFFMAGIAVSMISAIVFYIFDNTIKNEEEIEKYIHLKSLGSIPMNADKTEEIVDRDNAKSYVTECINTIRTNILYMNSANHAKTILITSCTPREGKSWVSANMAVAFADTDQKVLLIDADMRKGRAHKIFKVSNEEGLSNYLYDITEDKKENIKKAKQYIQETKIPNLHILTNGTIPPNPSELLESGKMKELLEGLKNVYDIIIVDAPPCKLVTDSIILSTIVDSTVLVANSEKTKMNDFNEVRKSIQMVGGEIIGTILNKKRIAGKTYHKGYYYGHSEINEIEETAKKKEIVPVDKLVEQGLLKLEVKGQEEVILDLNVTKIEKQDAMDEKNEELKTFIYAKLKELQKQYNQLINSYKDTSYIETLLEKVEQEKLTREQIEEIIKQEVAELKEEKLTGEQIEEIIKQEVAELKEEKLTGEQIEEIIKQKVAELKEEKITGEQIEEIIKQEIAELKEEKLTGEQIEEIIKQEVSKLKATEEIEGIYEQFEQTKVKISEMVNEIVSHNTEELRNTMQEEKDAEQAMQLLLNERINKMQEDTKNLLQQEINKIDYTEQIAQMNEMLVNLKDSYLELANKIKIGEIEKGTQQEIEEISNAIEENLEKTKNIIDFKSLIKQRNKKKKVFSIEEEITYEDLEQTAAYVIPLPTKKVSGEY